MKKTSRDLTEGSIGKQLILTAWPILLSGYIQTLYNSADGIIVGQFVGTRAMAAVAASEAITSFIVQFFLGLSVGAGVVFSRTFGAKDYKKLHDAIHTGFLASIIMGLALALAGYVASDAMLRLVNCPEDCYADALLYLRIYLIGVFMTSMYNILSGVLRAVGDTKTPTKVLIITGIANVILNLFSVLVLHMGVLGVALATIISQGISVALVLRKMVLTDDVYHLSFRELRIDGKLLKEIAALGIPTAIQNCLISIANLMIQRYKNSFGSIAMAGASAGGKLDRLINELSKSIGLALSTFTAQNLGAKKPERVEKSVRICLMISFSGVAFLGVILYIFCPTLLKIFTPDEEAIAYGVIEMRCLIPFYVCHVLMQVMNNVNRGTGYSMESMVINIVSMILLRQIFLNIIMQYYYTFNNVYISFGVGWTFSALLHFLFYEFKTKKTIRAQKAAG